MLGYVPSNLQVTFSQFITIFCNFRFQSQITAEIPPFLMQSLFCGPCEKAARYPGEVGTCDHLGQEKTRLTQLYFFWHGKFSAPAQCTLVGTSWLGCCALHLGGNCASLLSKPWNVPVFGGSKIIDQNLDTVESWPGWAVQQVQEVGIVLAVCVSLYRKKKIRRKSVPKQ